MNQLMIQVGSIKTTIKDKQIVYMSGTNITDPTDVAYSFLARTSLLSTHVSERTGRQSE